MKKKYLFLPMLLIFAVLTAILTSNSEPRVTKALESNSLRSVEKTQYFEVLPTDEQCMIEIESVDEYNRMVVAEKQYRSEIKAISEGYGIEMFNSNVNLGVSPAAIIIPPALDLPTVTLSGVANGGSTTSSVIVTYSLNADPMSTNKGAQYQIDNGTYYNFSSGTVFNAMGTYRLHLWNAMGHVYKTFTILGYSEDSSVVECTERGFLSLQTIFHYRPSDNYAIMEINASWDVMPGDFFRKTHSFILDCSANDWEYYRERGATLNISHTYNYEEYAAFTGLLTLEEERVETYSLNISDDIYYGVIESEDSNMDDILVFSYDSPLPNDVNAYNGLALDWYEKNYTSSIYSLKIYVGLTDDTYNISNFPGFEYYSSSATTRFVFFQSQCIFGAAEIDNGIGTFLTSLGTYIGILSIFIPFSPYVLVTAAVLSFTNSAVELFENWGLCRPVVYNVVAV